MEVYLKSVVDPSRGIFYIHIFTARSRILDTRTIEDSILKIGLPDAYFIPEGENIFMGTQEPMRLEEAIRETVKLIFDEDVPKRVMVHD